MLLVFSEIYAQRWCKRWHQVSDTIHHPYVVKGACLRILSEYISTMIPSHCRRIQRSQWCWKHKVDFTGGLFLPWLLARLNHDPIATPFRMFQIHDQLKSGNQFTPGDALPTNWCFGHYVDTTTGLRHHWFNPRIGLHAVIESTNQNPQTSWEPALILVIRENWMMDISFVVDIKLLKAHDRPMVDATMSFFYPNNLQVEHHYPKKRKKEN